ncbi:MAG: hypothetical protein O9335_03125 [Inhella sp.]|jgi:hypothetical protein|uniref:hypothetical protein n=1 Tax=Inhella sp. TaxID=1921806 RepID=UPI0022C8C894|nr:hypothetical protein [Inhella sp.]MCZ8234128.1 hypothetical protein [Inhella sp.]
MNMQWPTREQWEDAREQFFLRRIDYLDVASSGAPPEDLALAISPPVEVTESVWLSLWWAVKQAWLQEPMPIALGVVTALIALAGTVRLALQPG